MEDNYIGGVADEISAAAAADPTGGVTVQTLHVRSIPKSAKTPEETLKLVGLTADDIATAAQAMFDQSEA